MEEVSSLDSFHTDDGDEEATPRIVSEPRKRDVDADEMEDEEDDDGGLEHAHETEDAAGNTNDRADDGDAGDDDFEQISEGTFDVDEDHSQATSTEVIQPAKESSHGGGGASRSKEPDEEENTTVTDFETVDGNVSANTSAAADTEADMLGQADMTLPEKRRSSDPQQQQQLDDAANKSGDSAKMNVDNDDNEPPATTADVEMPSASNSPNTAGAATGSNARTRKGADEVNEASDDDGDDESLAAAAAGTADEEEADKSGGKEIVDAAAAASTTKPTDKTTVTEAAAGDDDGDDVEEDERGDKENYDQDAVAADGDVMDAPEDDEDDDDGENEDQPVENVQEPEESDVCLIPDDTETEMTDAEKEQAILARENAEKEDAEAQAEKAKEKEAAAAAANTATAESNELGDEEETTGENDGQANAEARAKQAGADAAEAEAASESSEETSHALDDANATADGDADADADEPLLEEMQSTEATADAGPTTTKTIIAWIVSRPEKCVQCGEEKPCGFRYRSADTAAELLYVCTTLCAEMLLAANPGKYFVRRKKFLVEEVSTTVPDADETPADGTAAAPTASDGAEGDEISATASGDVDASAAAKAKTAPPEHECLHCKETKSCQYFFKQDDENFYICNDACYNQLNAEEPDKFKLKRHSIRVRNIGATISGLLSPSARKATAAEARVVARTAIEAEAARLERLASFTRRCVECLTEITLGEKNLLWETMDFCNEICLGKYQRTIGAKCETCHGDVSHQALGKYCVRFGFDVRQFCCAVCLNEFKKGLKTCSCCQKDISGGNEGFLAPVGDKEQFKDFCSQACMRHYDSMCNPRKKPRTDTCAVCNNDKPVRVEILLDDKERTFCSNPCFSAFKFVSNIVADQCGMCAKYFERKSADAYTIYSERRTKVFCTRICLNVYIIVNRRIVSCQWCKVKKYNFDMIYKQQDAQEVLMCSLNCLTLYGVSINAFSRTVAKCDNCNTSATPQYHLTMSDASMRNFCTYQCVMQFQSQFARAPLTLENEGQSAGGTAATASIGGTSATASAKQAATMGGKGGAPFPTGLPKRVKLKASSSGGQILKVKQQQQQQPTIPVISTVASLAGSLGDISVRRGRCRGGRKTVSPSRMTQLGAPQPAMRGRPRKNLVPSIVDYDDRASSLSPPLLTPQRSSSGSGRRGPANGSGGSALSDGGGIGALQASGTAPTETRIIAVPPYPVTVRNVQTHCRPHTVSAGWQCKPNTATVGCQTEKDYSQKVLIPVPVPIYVPLPMYMYSAPFPVPVPIPLPIPVPIFIPTTRNSAQGILKEIKKIQDKMPTDPFEAELLMMAEMVAEEKRATDSGSDDEIKPEPNVVIVSNSMQQYGSGGGGNSNNNNNNSNSGNSVPTIDMGASAANHSYGGEDVLQLALKMATGEYDQAPSTVDLESAMTANTITNPPPGSMDNSMDHHHMGAQQQHGIQQAGGQLHLIDTPARAGRGRKRGAIAAAVSPAAATTTPRNNRSPAKRQRMQELDGGAPVAATSPANAQSSNEKPDANMCLKYTFGVNAWKQWVMTKNADMEKSSLRRRAFKTELLQMTADELNYSLCLFVKEVRKPNGTEYAPDTIYYLVLGIQQYLYENGRIDNIFTDPYYERFTDCLDEVARKFSVLYNDSQYIVTRVEEEHLWECKQLGAHSPHVLLSTLMFFNTKHFNLTTVEEHMQLSFSHIMKHWKRSAQNAKTSGTRNVLLRFYPPQAGLDANPRKKKVYEQQENEDNPLRCPVRLYEFYLSKCPESVKTRNDVFYLQPERSCVPDSPVWYSTQALSKDALQKMLHRVKMVKEINIALLTS